MRYFILSEHGGIGYLAALRILAQEMHDVCTFLVPSNEAEIWKSDPQLHAHLASKAAIVVVGDAKNTDDVQRAWHVAEMGIDSECSGIEAVIISDVPSQLKTSGGSDELLAVFKCFPGYPYPPFQLQRESYGYAPRSPRALSVRTSPLPIHMPRSPSYSSRCPRLILISPSRSLRRLHSAARGSKEELAVAWATGKKANSITIPYTPVTAPGTPIHADSHSIHSSYSAQLTLSKTASLFPDADSSSDSESGGWLDPKHTLIVRPAALVRRRCRGDEGSSVPYRIQDESTRGGWTISKRDVAHFIVEKALDQWSTWGGRRVRIAY